MILHPDATISQTLLQQLMVLALGYLTVARYANVGTTLTVTGQPSMVLDW